jgi:hypothetical protein
MLKNAPKTKKPMTEEKLYRFLRDNEFIYLSNADLLELGIFGSADVIARIKVLNTFQLLELGILNTDGETPCITDLDVLDVIKLLNFPPEARIETINASGVRIDTIFQILTDHRGITHKRVVLYKIVNGRAS